jgi:hypothetical protein
MPYDDHSHAPILPDIAAARRPGGPRSRVSPLISHKRFSQDRRVMENTVMTDLDSTSVIDAVADDPQLRVFLSNGRIEAIPAKQLRRRLLLDKIAQAFEPGVRYPERRVSLFLGSIHPDYAALRRYLVDEDFLSRADGEYWRSGGTVADRAG